MKDSPLAKGPIVPMIKYNHAVLSKNLHSLVFQLITFDLIKVVATGDHLWDKNIPHHQSP
jgi:hypothetical protein